MQADRQERLAESGHPRRLPRRADQARSAFSLDTGAPGRIGRSFLSSAHSLQRTIGNAATTRLVEQERHQPGTDRVVQRMLSKTSRPFFQQWAGDGTSLTPQQRNWVWNKLVELTGHEVRVKKLSPTQALELLAKNNVTKDAMDAEMGHSASTAQASQAPETMEQYEEQAKATVLAADEAWRARQPQMPKPETVTFHIEGLGRGTVAMLKSPSGSKNPGMLSWFSHGYEDKHRIAINTERKYGFAVRKEQSLNRVGATADAFASLPDAFANAGVQPTKNAPGQYVRPHHATELSVGIDRVVGLVKYSDVAVLLDFQWSDNVADEYAQARKAETPPLPVIIENAQAFRGYNALLIYACRTPWSVNAAAEGSSKLKENLQKELMEKEKLSAEEAKKRAQEKYEAAPRAGEVHQ